VLVCNEMTMALIVFVKIVRHWLISRGVMINE